MKKKRIFLIIFLIFTFLNCFNVFALGLTPAKIEVDFVPKYKFKVDFTVLGGEKNLLIYADGPFEENVRFDKENVSGGQGFTAYVDLPEETESYGENPLFIRVQEQSTRESGIGTRLAVGALILIKVPYPGQYAEISKFSLNDANIGEPINFTIRVSNLGQENIAANAKIEIKNSRKETIKELDLGNKFIESPKEETFTKVLNTSSFRPGTYNSTAIVDYGKELLKQEESFRIGTLFVNITNYTRKVEQGKIGKFIIKIQNKWNDDIENVYAEVNVTKDGNMTDFFKTPSISLEAWKEAELSGFLNSENVDSGTYDANISLYYNKKITSKIGDVEIIGTFNYLFFIILGAVILLAVIIVIVLLLIKQKNGKKK
jgi:hypothetical protein